MRRDTLADLAVFLCVAEERSFTRAAAALGTSQSAISQIVRRLEAAMGVKLLTRTTRAVALTVAGEQLASTLRPAFDDIDARLNALTALAENPSGELRITTSKHAAQTVLWPVLKRMMQDYPDISVELSLDGRLIDIVAERFDAGVRLGEQVAKDMIAVRIGPDLRMAVVAAPAYLERFGHPATPHELTRHRCINLRLPTAGGLYAWEFEKEGRAVNVRVDGPLIFNDVDMMLQAAQDGLALAYVLEGQVTAHLASGRLVRVLEDWCPYFPGYHLYYPDRRQLPAAFTLLVNALRYRP